VKSPKDCGPPPPSIDDQNKNTQSSRAITGLPIPKPNFPQPLANKAPLIPAEGMLSNMTNDGITMQMELQRFKFEILAELRHEIQESRNQIVESRILNETAKSLKLL
jgi:hypothetical protein